MLHLYFRTLITCWKVFGFGRVFLGWLIGEPFLRLFTAITLWADRLFYPHYRKVTINKPVFIIGHPRSGTTFLHKLLAQAEGAVSFKAWHLRYPALTARLIMRPLVRHLIKTKRDVILPAETGHKISLGSIEEEEMLFLHKYDTQFFTGGLLAFDERDYREINFHDQQSEERRLRSMRFLKGCFQRQMESTGVTGGYFME
ncbi:MAG: hypothetical protein D3910_06485 [Candidatus Electrothrix sp. ATG2]|nr:hypothetical protein [Candidatus Electrothrix sp. ATG2]